MNYFATVPTTQIYEQQRKRP